MKQFFTLISLLISFSSWAYTPSPEAEISILTCSPGKEIYKIYGHTAIRYQDNGRDIVFNYGLFSFDEPHFIWRYLQGKNYYLLGVESYKRFIRRYEQGGERVTEQTLNLTNDETQTLYNALIKNAKPENRKYLYNVFYDNCATRAYKIIEDKLEGDINWQYHCKEASYRELLHQHNHPMPFSQMGIDIVFGTQADELCSCREQMFLPLLLKDELETALKSNGKPLLKETQTLIEGQKIHNNEEIILFNLIFSLLLAIAIYARFVNRKLLKAYRILIYLLVGLLSFVVCFIAFFSIHPTVLPNLNLIWMNPLWLFFAIRLIVLKRYNITWQKILNTWSVLIAIYLILGIFGVYYIHYGLIYILTTLLILSYKKKAYR